MTDAAPAAPLFGEWLSWTPLQLPPSPWNALVPLFAWLFGVADPRLVVELGSGDGDSLRPLCQIAELPYHGRCTIVAVDRWNTDALRPWDGSASYEALREYCALRHPDVVSVRRADEQEAVAELADASVDLLHLVGDAGRVGAASLDAESVIAKVRPGGVIVMTSTGARDAAAEKLWAAVAEHVPANVLRLPHVVGIAQVPRDGATPIVQLLEAHPDGVAALFRALGERVEHRHVLGSEPRTAANVRRYVADMAEAAAADLSRIEAQHEVARAALERELASSYERLLERSREVATLQDDADLLLARVATASAQREALAAERDAERARLLAEITDREAQLDALRNTVSWRVTRPLRLVQSLRLFVRRALRRPSRPRR
jgi:hypothetical protein